MENEPGPDTDFQMWISSYNVDLNPRISMLVQYLKAQLQTY